MRQAWAFRADLRAKGEPMTLTVAIPMRLESAANLREPWAVAWRRNESQANTVHKHVLRALGRRERLTPRVVTFCRIAPRLLDDDNLARAFKAVRDTVARVYAVDDGPKGPITWRYAQRKGAYGIEIGLET